MCVQDYKTILGSGGMGEVSKNESTMYVYLNSIENCNNLFLFLHFSVILHMASGQIVTSH
jgi:hypothetical protein